MEDHIHFDAVEQNSAHVQKENGACMCYTMHALVRLPTF